MTEDQAKQILRRQDSIEKTLNLIYKDRDILEDLAIRLGKVEDQVRYLAERVDKMEKNNRADNKGILEEVQEVRDNVEEVVKTIGGD